MGGLGYRHFGRLQRRVQIFGGSENIFFVIFGRCTFVYVCVICPSLVLGGCWRPGYKAAVCFWLCYADVCLIMLSNDMKRGIVNALKHNLENMLIIQKLSLDLSVETRS